MSISKARDVAKLFTACKKGDMDSIRRMSNLSSVVNERDEKGRIPLSMAIQRGSWPVFEYLVNIEDIDINAKDDGGRTPLSLAAEKGLAKFVQRLLDIRTTEIEASDDEGQTPLAHAAKRGHWAVIHLLAESKAELESLDKNHRSPLSLAAQGGHQAVVRRLLSRIGTIKHDKDQDGRTPLSFAAEGGHEAVVDLLLQVTALSVVNIKDNNDNTPLSFAAKEGHQAVLSRLLQAKEIEADSKNKNHRTPLSLAAARGHVDIVRRLLNVKVNCRINLDSQDKGGRTPLSFSAGEGHNNIIEKLINAGAKLSVLDHKQRSPISYAAAGGHEGSVKLLLPRDNIEIVDDEGRTPLYFAVENGFGNIVDILLTAKETKLLVNANPPNEEMRKVLLIAARTSRWSLVEILLKHGADPSPLKADQSILRAFEARLASEMDYERRLSCRRVKTLLDGRPFVDQALAQDNKSSPWAHGTINIQPSENDEARKQVCEYFRAHIQFHRKSRFQEISMPMWNLLYSPKVSSGDWAAQKFRPQWKWFHLPASNKLWVKHLIHILRGKRIIPSNDKFEQFVQNSYHEIRGATPHACFRQPKFINDPSNDMFSLSISYFDMETESYLSRNSFSDAKSKNPDVDHFRYMQKLEDSYRISTAAEYINLHVSRTLDQSYYTALLDTKARDHDQVIYRHTLANNIPKGRQPSDETLESKQWSSDADRVRLLMVHQLWLWRIGDTIITAFPERWYQGQDQLLDHIIQAMRRHSPETLDGMILRIVHECSGFIDEPLNCGLEENWVDIFNSSIADQSAEATSCYNMLHSVLREGTKILQSVENPETSRTTSIPQSKFVEAEDIICNISSEMECLRLTKDIRDELKMVEHVLRSQMKAVSDYLAYVIPPEDVVERESNTGNVKRTKVPNNGPIISNEVDDLYDKLKESLELRLIKLVTLQKDAAMVEESLNHLLGLKQQQGNLNEARDTRRLADEADKRARESETQSKLLYVFTIVTVIFAPLSFVAAFFAIPSQAFPSSGSTVNWNIGKIAAGMGVAEVMTLLPVIGYWVIIQLIKARAEKQAERTLPQDTDETPLSWAAAHGYEKLVELLLKRSDVKVNFKDSQERTALSWAAEHGFEGIARLLLLENADSKAQSKSGKTALSYAAANGHIAVVKLLLRRQGLDGDFSDAEGPTALSYAAKNGHETVVKMLLEHNVDPDSKFNNSQTSLSLAAANGHTGVVKLLLQYGADPDHKDFEGETPMSRAAKNEKKDMVRLLLTAERMTPHHGA